MELSLRLMKKLGTSWCQFLTLTTNSNTLSSAERWQEMNGKILRTMCMKTQPDSGFSQLSVDRHPNTGLPPIVMLVILEVLNVLLLRTAWASPVRSSSDVGSVMLSHSRALLVLNSSRLCTARPLEQKQNWRFAFCTSFYATFCDRSQSITQLQFPLCFS